MEGVLASQMARALQDGTLQLKSGDVVRTTNYACIQITENDHRQIISELEIAAPDSGAHRDQAPAPCAGGDTQSGREV